MSHQRLFVLRVLPRARQYGAHDLLIAGAAAQIAIDSTTDISIGWPLVLKQERLTRQDHARRAIAALKSVFLDEGLLQRVKLTAGDKPFDGGDGSVGDQCCENRAGMRRLSIDSDGTGSAIARIASSPCTREPERIP